MSSTQLVWRLPVILVSFSDSTLRHTPLDFDFGLFDSTHTTATGSMCDYYQWVSRGRLTITGKVIGVVRLPHPRDYYGGNLNGLNAGGTPNNSLGMARDALDQLRLSGARVDWSEFDLDRDGYADMLWVVHAGVGGEASHDRNDLWSYTSRMTGSWHASGAYVTNQLVPGSKTQYLRLDRFTILPELSSVVAGARSEIGVYCHEFGHALGLPDLYDTSRMSPNTGTGNWSLMSSGAFGGDGRSPQYPTHLGAWPLQFLGWDDTSKPSRDTSLTLQPIARGGRVLDVWFQGEPNPEEFLVENRQRDDFDRNLPTEGLVVYHIDRDVIGSGLLYNRINAGLTPGLTVVEADGNNDIYLGHDRGDDSDPFPGALGRTSVDDDSRPSLRTFMNQATNLALRNITPIGKDIRVTAQVRARGWLPPDDHTGAGYQPALSSGGGAVSGVDAKGTATVVASEMVGGHPQIVVHTNADGWLTSFQVSSSPGSALEPSLAVMPGGDLAVVWSDTRDGRGRIYFRSRIRGVWTPERLLVALSGTCKSPAIAADRRGALSLAFRYLQADTVAIRFMRFTYFSPFGQSLPVTGTGEQPDPPSIVVGPDQGATIAWVDRGATAAQIWFARFHPDSGLSRRQPLTPATALPQPAFSMVVDASGALHVAWLLIGPGVYEIHYTRRPRLGGPNPIDDLLETHGSFIQSISLALGADSTLHVVYEASAGGLSEIRYKPWSPYRGWDVRSTEVTTPDMGSASRPVALPGADGVVSIAYVGYRDLQPRFMVRRRLATDPSLIGVIAAPSPAVAIAALAIGPSPLGPGRGLDVAWRGTAERGAPIVDVLDVAGRRLGALTLSSHGDGRWVGRFAPAITAGWPTGVHFARVRERAGATARIVVLR